MIRLVLLVAFLVIGGAIPAGAVCAVVSAFVNPIETGVIYYDLLTHSAPSNNEANENGWLPPIDMIASNISAKVDVAPGSGKSWIITLRADLADLSPSLTCTIADLETTCENLSTETTLAALSETTIEVEGINTPAASAEILLSLCVEPAP